MQQGPWAHSWAHTPAARRSRLPIAREKLWVVRMDEHDSPAPPIRLGGRAVRAPPRPNGPTPQSRRGNPVALCCVQVSSPTGQAPSRFQPARPPASTGNDMAGRGEEPGTRQGSNGPHGPGDDVWESAGGGVRGRSERAGTAWRGAVRIVPYPACELDCPGTLIPTAGHLQYLGRYSG